IDIASTMVSLTLVAHALGGSLAYDSIAFAKAVAALQGVLESQPVQDPTKPDALIAKTEELAKSVADLNAVVGGPFGEGGNVSPSPTPVASGQATDAASPSPTGASPQASTSPVASAAVSTAPSTATSVAPSPTASLSGSPSPSPIASP